MDDNERKIAIKIGNEKIIVKLFWNEAPNLCNAIWSKLPIETHAHLAKICNHEIMMQLPFCAPKENLKPPTPGDVGWWDERQSIYIFFDKLGPQGPLSPKVVVFGHVVSNLEGLAIEGMKIWTKAGVRTRLFKENVPLNS